MGSAALPEPVNTPADDGRRLDDLLGDLAERHGRGLLEEAAAEARSEVKRILRDRLVQRMLRELEPAIPDALRTRPPPAERPSDPTAIDGVIHRMEDATMEPAEERFAEPVPPGEAETPGTGIYVYGIVEGAAALPEDVPMGVGGHGRVSLLGVDGIRAVVSQVSLAEFAGDALHANLQDPEWLEAAVVAHEGILARLREASTVLPLRFGTVFEDERQATDALAELAEGFREDLERLHGCGEWSLKVVSDWDSLVAWVEAADERIAALRAELRSSPEGRSFFLRRRVERIVAEEARAVQRNVVADALGLLADVAEDAVSTDLIALGEASGPVVARASYLVDARGERELRRVIEEVESRHASAGFSFRLTGPWAPYSFVSAGRNDGTAD